MAGLSNGLGIMEDSEIDYEDWRPPTEAELKVIEAKRDHQDKISKLMGQYLLKGYKMLGDACTVCGTILLRTKQGVDYCVACNELDSDSTKDDPALNDVAALRQAQESHLKQVTTTAEAGEPCMQVKEASESLNSRDIGVPESTDTTAESSICNLATGAKAKDPSLVFQRPTARESVPIHRIDEQTGEAVEAVMEKLDWATRLLHQTQDIDTSVRLCNLIKSCADAVRSLRSADSLDT